MMRTDMCGETMSPWNSDVGVPTLIQTSTIGHKEVCVREECAETSLNSSVEGFRLTALLRTATILNSGPEYCSIQAMRGSATIEGLVSAAAETSVCWTYHSQATITILKTQC